MAIFGIKTEISEIVKTRINLINKNLISNNVILNPFKGKIIEIANKDELIYISDIMPIYPDVSLFGLFLFGIMFYFLSWSWFLIIPSIITLTHVLFTERFYFEFLKKSLRKGGYRGKIDLMSKSEALKYIIWDSAKS